LHATIWNDVYQHAKVQNKIWNSKEKLIKDKVIPIHGQQNQILDMANFEIIFLSN